jgi:replication factor C subunit 1
LNIIGIATISFHGAPEYVFVLQGHPSPMDDIQPAVKSALTKAYSALTKAYKQGTSYPISRSNKYLRQETQTLKKRVATLLEPFDESLPDKSGVASAKSVEEAFDAENDGM